MHCVSLDIYKFKVIAFFRTVGWAHAMHLKTNYLGKVVIKPIFSWTILYSYTHTVGAFDYRIFNMIFFFLQV